MNAFKTNTPSAPAAIAAILMTVLTLAVCVSAPTELARPAPALALAASPRQPELQLPATEVDIVPGRIDVVAVREPSLQVTLMRMLHPKHKQQV